MKEILDVINMALVALECPVAGCDLGVNGAKYKTPELEAELTMEMLRLHGQSHLQIPSANSTLVTSRKMRERQKKASVGMKMTE